MVLTKQSCSFLASASDSQPQAAQCPQSSIVGATAASLQQLQVKWFTQRGHTGITVADVVEKETCSDWTLCMQAFFLLYLRVAL